MSLLVSAFATCRVFASWESYVPRTLASVIEAHPKTLPAESQYVFTANNFPSRVRIIYEGQVRPIEAGRLEFISQYLGKVRGHPEWVPYYVNEVLCREGEARYWLPIQEPVLQYFKDEVKEGASVDLFVTWIGARSDGEEVDWLFTINEFQVPAQQTP